MYKHSHHFGFSLAVSLAGIVSLILWMKKMISENVREFLGDSRIIPSGNHLLKLHAKEEEIKNGVSK